MVIYTIMLCACVAQASVTEALVGPVMSRKKAILALCDFLKGDGEAVPEPEPVQKKPSTRYDGQVSKKRLASAMRGVSKRPAAAMEAAPEGAATPNMDSYSETFVTISPHRMLLSSRCEPVSYTLLISYAPIHMYGVHVVYIALGPHEEAPLRQRLRRPP